MLSLALTVATETAESSGPNPYAVGGAVLVFLLAMLIALVAFGGGREHS